MGCPLRCVFRGDHKMFLKERERVGRGAEERSEVLQRARYGELWLLQALAQNTTAGGRRRGAAGSYRGG